MTTGIAGDRPPRYGVSGISRSDRGGQAPALRAWKNAPYYRRARACPSPCPDPIKNRSSGVPAPERVDGKKNGPGYRRARACPSPCPDPIKNRSSGAPAPERVMKSRGTGPRATVSAAFLAAIAGDRPPRYEASRPGGLSYRSLEQKSIVLA